MATCAPLQPIGPRPIPLNKNETIRRWWANVEKCSGKRWNIDRTRFYVVDVSAADGVSVADRSPGYVWAGSSVGREKITIGLPWVLDSTVVEHEMAHPIASPGWHDPEIFLRRCADQVICKKTCRTDTLPRLPSSMASRS